MCCGVWMGECLDCVWDGRVDGVSLLIIIKVGREKGVVGEVGFVLVMKIVVVYKGLNGMCEGIEIVVVSGVWGMGER